MTSTPTEIIESIKVAEFLPILDTIKNSLNLLYERDYVMKPKERLSSDSIDISLKNQPHVFMKSVYCKVATQEEGIKEHCYKSLEDLIPKKYLNEAQPLDESLRNYVKHLQDSLIKDDAALDKSDEVAKLSKELKNKDKKILGFEALVDDLNRKVEEFQTSYDYIEVENKEIIKDVEEKQRIINENINIIQEKDKVIHRLTAQVENTKSGPKIKETEKIIEDKNIEIQKLNKDIAELTSTLKTLKADTDKRNKSNEDRILSLEKEHGDDLEEKEVLENELGEKVKRIHKLEADCVALESLKDELERKKQVIETLHVQVKELKELNEIQANQTELISDMKKKINQYESKESTIDDTYSALHETLKSKRMECKAKTDEIAKLTETNEELKDIIDAFERDLRSKDRQLKRTTAELEEAQKEISDLEKDIRKKTTEIKSANKKNRNDDDKEKEKDKYMKEIQQLKTTVIGIKREMGVMSSENDELRKQKDALDKNVKNREMELVKTNKEIRETKLKLENLNKTIADQGATIKQKQIAMDNMKEKIRQANEPNPSDTNEMRVLKRTIEAKESEMDQMEQKLENYKKSLEDKFQECELLKKEADKSKTELENIKKLNFNRGMSGDQAPIYQEQTYQRQATPPPAPRAAFSKPTSPTNRSNGPQYPEWWYKHMRY